MAISIANKKTFYNVMIHFITPSRSVGNEWKEANESQYSFVSIDEIPVFSSKEVENNELMYVVHEAKEGLTPFFATFERSVAEDGCFTLQEKYVVDFSSVSFIEKYKADGDLTPIHYVFSK